jgi:hypothetical protein
MLEQCQPAVDPGRLELGDELTPQWIDHGSRAAVLPDLPGVDDPQRDVAVGQGLHALPVRPYEHQPATLVDVQPGTGSPTQGADDCVVRDAPPVVHRGEPVHRGTQPRDGQPGHRQGPPPGSRGSAAVRPIPGRYRRDERGHHHAGHDDHPRRASEAIERVNTATTGCSRALKHGHLKCCRDATVWCPRTDLDQGYMIVLREELLLM